jgi:hypothetical protein
MYSSSFMAPTILPDLNCTTPEDLDGRVIPREGNSAAFEGGDAPAQDEGVNMLSYVV